MATITSLVDDIIADIPEIPAFTAERQYVRALKELCQEARVWRVDGTLGLTADTATLDVSSLLPTGTELVDVISIKPSGGEQALKARTQAWLDTNESDWRGQVALVPSYYVLEENNVLRLVPTPSNTVANALYVRAAVKPIVGTATTVDDLVVNKFGEMLISGAKAHLFMIPRKPWTDLQLAQYHRANFLAAIPEARAQATDEFQTGVGRKVKYGGL